MTVNRKFFIAGVQYRGRDIVELVKGLEEGQILSLEAEPTNVYDPNAIKIIYEDDFGDTHHIGYVPKVISSEISVAMELEPLICIVVANGEKSYQCEVVVKTFNEEEDLLSEEEIDDLDDDGYEEPDDPDELTENEDFAKDNLLERDDE